jgi:asparagine synthetase B (glutamine-hydrolysing)
MSKILYVVNRCIGAQDISKKVRKICDDINADNINPLPSKVITSDNITLGISNPIEGFEILNSNILLGHTLEENAIWHDFSENYFNGNYAIFRSNPEKIQIITDILGTKSIWYYYDSEQFIASTSQRAIIKYLGSFYFNEKVIPWVLANGLLGPGLSWDKRLSLIEPDTILNLDRSDWTLKYDTKACEFKANNLSDKENLDELRKRLKNTFLTTNIDYAKWVLTLSGGYDSRGLICLLPKSDKKSQLLNTITWGTLVSKKDKLSDAAVAQKIAKKLNVPNKYLLTDGSIEPLESILNRFFENGEGRIDHIGGYLDGFEIWKKLFESNVRGVIRGDEVFGSYDFISEFHLKEFIGLCSLSDYDNLKNDTYLNSIDVRLPDKYHIKEGETFERWRDRLYQIYLVPYFLSALSDLKHSYVEQINPFLSRDIIYWIRQMPDHLRTDKRAFKKLINEMNPNVEFAKTSSTLSFNDIFGDKKIVEIIHKELKSDLASVIFPKDFLKDLIKNTKGIDHKYAISSKSKFLKFIKIYIPKPIKRKILKKTFKPYLDSYQLSFRAFLIIRMYKLFKTDTSF